MWQCELCKQRKHSPTAVWPFISFIYFPSKSLGSTCKLLQKCVQILQKKSDELAPRYDFPLARLPMSWTLLWVQMSGTRRESLLKLSLKITPQWFPLELFPIHICFFPPSSTLTFSPSSESNYSHPASIIFPSITLLCACISVCVCLLKSVLWGNSDLSPNISEQREYRNECVPVENAAFFTAINGYVFKINRMTIIFKF